MAAEALRCGCEGKFCRRPRLSWGIRIIHYRRKWHRLQILLSIQGVCACVCVCVYSHRAAILKKCWHSNRNQCSAHVTCLWFCFLLCRLFCFSLDVLYQTPPHRRLALNRSSWLHLPRKEESTEIRWAQTVWVVNLFPSDQQHFFFFYFSVY